MVRSPRTASVLNSSATLSQCLPTALLHCLNASRQLLYTVSVPPDSSSTLFQCLPTALLHCLSASRQLLYTIPVPSDSSSKLSQCLQTALLHCLGASRQLLYTVPVHPDSSSTVYPCQTQTQPSHAYFILDVYLNVDILYCSIGVTHGKMLQTDRPDSGLTNRQINMHTCTTL